MSPHKGCRVKHDGDHEAFTSIVKASGIEGSIILENQDCGWLATKYGLYFESSMVAIFFAQKTWEAFNAWFRTGKRQVGNEAFRDATKAYFGGKTGFTAATFAFNSLQAFLTTTIAAGPLGTVMAFTGSLVVGFATVFSTRKVLDAPLKKILTLPTDHPYKCSYGNCGASLTTKTTVCIWTHATYDSYRHTCRKCKRYVCKKHFDNIKRCPSCTHIA